MTDRNNRQEDKTQNTGRQIDRYTFKSYADSQKSLKTDIHYYRQRETIDRWTL